MDICSICSSASCHRHWSFLRVQKSHWKFAASLSILHCIRLGVLHWDDYFNSYITSCIIDVIVIIWLKNEIELHNGLSFSQANDTNVHNLISDFLFRLVFHRYFNIITYTCKWNLLYQCTIFHGIESRLHSYTRVVTYHTYMKFF